MQPVCLLFWGLNPPKEGPFHSRQGSFGFQVCVSFGCSNSNDSDVKHPLKVNQSPDFQSLPLDSPTRLLDLFKMIFTFYHEKSPLNHHLGNMFLFFQPPQANLRRKYHGPPPKKWKDLVQMRSTSADANQGSSHAVVSG